MIDHSVANLSVRERNIPDININKSDRTILRQLANHIANLAARPVEEEKRKLWYRHNDLGSTRPLIFCDPENGWNEVITEDQIECTDKLARKWEMILRKEIFWGESMGDDRVTETHFNVPYVSKETDWGMKEIIVGGYGGGAYRWDAPLKNYEDLTKLHYPGITVDYEKTNSLYELANEIFGDILSVRIKCSWWWTLGLTWVLVKLRGLEQIMYDMYDFPEELHKLMAFLRDGHLSKLDYLEKSGLLTLNNDGTYVGSGGFGWTNQLPQKDYNGKNIRTIDMWGFAESQETSQVSPEMFAEFIFPYQKPILERFGLNCYGCCESLNKRWEIIKQIPRLRRVSVSPWANLEDMSDKLQDKYIYSLKPNPAYLAVHNIDEDYIRRSLKESMRITRHNCTEIIMKDNNTLGGNPQNAVRWCKIAKEEVEKI